MAQKITEMVSSARLRALETDPTIKVLKKEFCSVVSPAIGGWSGYEVTYEKRRLNLIEEILNSLFLPRLILFILGGGIILFVFYVYIRPYIHGT